MGTAPDAARVCAFFAQPGFGWILDRLAERMSRGRSLTGIIANAHATPEERRALDDLLGRRSTAGKQLSLDLAELEQTLRSTGMADRLEDAVVACRGAIENQRARAERQQEEWTALFDGARTRCSEQDGLLNWISAFQRDGSLKRIARGDLAVAARLVENAIRVLLREPSEEILLANLAAECVGDSHALDRGQPLATLCLRAIGSVHGIDGQRSADARRKAWASIGVIIDDLSAPVLVYNLRAAPDSALGSVLELHRQQKQPAFLTYRQLQSGNSFQPLHPAMCVIFVCENPSVVSAAVREIGGRCHPLVCTNGQPASATHLLLLQLRQAGAELRCHGDFDWAGLRIIDQLARQHAAIPWKMSADAYLAAEGTVVAEPQSFVTSWAPELGDALRDRARAVYEEQVLSSLLQDLVLPERL
ncbi:MAG: TIGR02679 family protein [Chthoniobacter sp.]|uniref:TIGR02679 family protein n=1 Tax=Chthoniobacter sp. TaxID=2510640 RepID=UPI0032AA630D